MEFTPKQQATLLTELEVDSFKPYQLTAIQAILSNKDVFVAQPTSSGKSLIFQALPLANKLYSDTTKCVLIIQPIVSLMLDQMNTLKKQGVKVVCLKQKKELLAGTNKDEVFDEMLSADMIFSSPEAIQDFRGLFKNEMLSERIICIAVDECHMVEKW